jgi:hypothetical protein
VRLGNYYVALCGVLKGLRGLWFFFVFNLKPKPKEKFIHIVYTLLLEVSGRRIFFLCYSMDHYISIMIHESRTTWFVLNPQINNNIIFFKTLNIPKLFVHTFAQLKHGVLQLEVLKTQKKIQDSMKYNNIQKFIQVRKKLYHVLPPYNNIRCYYNQYVYIDCNNILYYETSEVEKGNTPVKFCKFSF